MTDPDLQMTLLGGPLPFALVRLTRPRRRTALADAPIRAICGPSGQFPDRLRLRLQAQAAKVKQAA